MVTRLPAGFHQGLDIIIYFGVGVEDILKIGAVDDKEDSIFQGGHAKIARPSSDQRFFADLVTDLKHAILEFFTVIRQCPRRARSPGR